MRKSIFENKYFYFALILLIVFGITYYENNKKKVAETFWVSNNSDCQVGEGCSDIKVRLGYGVGDTIPNIVVHDLDGKAVNLYDLVKGKKKIYLNLTTDWCSDCQAEQKTLQANIEAVGDEGIVIPIFVAFKDEKTNIEQLKEYAKNQNYPFPVYIDQSKTLLNHFKVNGTPTNVYIDETGRIKIIGQEMTLSQLVDMTKN